MASAGYSQSWNKKHQKALPKGIPEMMPVTTKTITIGIDGFDHPTTISGYSFNMSKYEVSNKDFCRFLNVDSIAKDSLLISNIIKLDNAHCKIIYQDKKFVPVKGFENFPVLMVNWWGAKYYCEWLTKHVNDRLIEKGEWKEPNYRLPAEFEWVCAASDTNLLDKYKTMCDSIGLYLKKTQSSEIRDTRSSRKNTFGIYGLNDNAFEWTEDDFLATDWLVDWSLSAVYFDDNNPEAVIRKHGGIYDRTLKNNCGREGRLKDGFYSDTGFRIVKTTLGRAVGGEF
jgi:formylglycine-generating enzyme required for sulfatase activity